MASTYTTIQGDAWDMIAFRLFGDEKYMKNLIEANWEFADILVFSSGAVLTVPDIPEEADESGPFWRTTSAESGGSTYSPTTEVMAV